jgi:hypothetical protein
MSNGPLERLVERCLCGGCPACGVPDPDPVELTQTQRQAPAAEILTAITDDDRVAGGQGHTDADIGRSALVLLWTSAIAAGCLLGWAAASGVVALADAVGAWCVS